MTDKLLMNRGGLHNRIRHRIYLKPFTLKETEEYLKSQGAYWDRYQILPSVHVHRRRAVISQAVVTEAKCRPELGRSLFFRNRSIKNGI